MIGNAKSKDMLMLIKGIDKIGKLVEQISEHKLGLHLIPRPIAVPVAPPVQVVAVITEEKDAPPAEPVETAGAKSGDFTMEESQVLAGRLQDIRGFFSERLASSEIELD